MGGVAVAAADFVGGGSPFVLATIHDAVGHARRSSASRLPERRRRSWGGGDMDEDDEDDDDEEGYEKKDAAGREQQQQYKSARVVLLALAPDGLALLRTSQPVAEPVHMAASGHHGRLLIAGAVGKAAAASASGPPMRLVALPDVVGYPILGPTPAALFPGPPAPWPAFLSANAWPRALTAVAVHTRLYVRSGEAPPLLLPKTMLMAQPLHALQGRRAEDGAASKAAGMAGVWGSLLPATLGELRAAIPSAAAQLQQLQQLPSSTLLWPFRIEARAGLALVACRVVGPLEQPFTLIQQHSSQQQLLQEQDGHAGFSTISLLVRCASTSSSAEATSPLLYAAVGRDAIFTSDAALAALSLEGREVTAVQLNGEQWVAQPLMAGVDPPAYHIFPVPAPAATGTDAVLLAQSLGISTTRLVLARQAQEQAGQGGTTGWDGQALLELQEGECIKDAAWQTGLLDHAGPSAPPAPSPPVLGLLTSRRVLLVAHDLTVLVAMPLASSSPALHLLWLGPALAVATAEGQLSYLDVDARSGALSLRPLCALDHRHTGARVLAALPDRLVYAAWAGAVGGAQVLSRPLLPLEPLVLGSLALLPRLLHSTADAEASTARVDAVIEAVVGRYGPAWLEQQQTAGPLYGAGEGPGANAGITGTVCAALARTGFVEAAACLAGMATKGSAYPRRPWVPAAVKAGLAAAAGPRGRQWMSALAEALADDPAAQEYALHPTSFSSAALPPRHRRLSRALAALGDGARRAGQAEAALRVLDVAGEDEAVVSLLLLHLLGQGPGPASEDWAGLLRELFAARTDPHLLALVEALWPEWRGPADATSGEAVAATLVGPKLSSQTFPTATQRRLTLLPTLPADRELPSWRQAQGAGEEATAAAAAALLSAAAAATGPPRSARLRRLVLDRVEEWLGRGAPEGLSDDEEGELGDEGPGGATAAVATTAGGVPPPGEGVASSTTTWVKGVGQGREDEDNVVLYYRFGEMVPQGGGGGHGGQQQQQTPAPLQFLQGDSSPYAHVLEVLGAVAFEPSTCPIDPGDEGKVRPAMDAIWLGDSATGASGLRVRAPRGSALDVGPYHAAGPRAKLTVEAWVQRPEGAAATGAGYEVLLSRRTLDDADAAAASSSAALWSLGIAPDGALALWTGAAVPEGEEGKEGTPLHRTAAGAVPEGKWTHVAFTLEAKGKASVEVALFVRGRPAAAGPVLLRVPVLGEARLLQTVLEVGPGLGAGHRLTELRAWALLRHADDLYDNRESYLKLAEKRKRLAFRIKGGGGGGGGIVGASGEAAASIPAAPGPALLGQPPLPTAIGIGMAPPPPSPAPALARRRGLTPPPPGIPATKAATEGLQAPPPLLPAAPSQRRPLSERRPSPTQQATEGAAATASSSMSPPPLPPLPPSVPAPTAATGWASEFGSWEGNASASAPASAAASSSTAPSAAQLVVKPADLRVDAAQVLRDPMLAPAFSPQGRFLCFRESAPATAPKCSIVVLALSGAGAPRCMRYPFQADSAILVEGEGEAAETSSLIACATSGSGGEGGGGGSGGALAVYDLAQRKGVARQPAATQIVHWRWLAPRQLALVTARAVFIWSIAGGPSPPSKLWERRDGGRRVRAYHQAGGWGLLLSDDDGERQQDGGVVAQLYDQQRGRLYLESGGGLVGVGIGPCGGSGGGSGGDGDAEDALSLVAVRRASDGAVRLELYDMAAAATARGEAGSAGAPPSLLAALPKLAEATLPAPAAAVPPVWVFFPQPGASGMSAINVLFGGGGGGGGGGLLASWRPLSHAAVVVAVHQPVLTGAGAVVADACLDAQGDLLVLQAGELSVWRLALR